MMLVEYPRPMSFAMKWIAYKFKSYIFQSAEIGLKDRLSIGKSGYFKLCIVCKGYIIPGIMMLLWAKLLYRVFKIFLFLQGFVS